MALLESECIALGTEAPQFDLQGTDDMNYSLADFSDKKGLLIVFMCNHCPYARAAWPLLIDLFSDFEDDIGFIAINSNDADAYEEDSFDAMRSEAESMGIPFPYVWDERQAVAEAYEAQCTPDPYLYKRRNNSFELFYHGRINDSWQDEETVTEESLRQAMRALLSGGMPPSLQKPSMGCSIKWKE